MKGHPGYQGDDIDYVANIARRVGSPRAKILFDIYHVQIMNGDVIRRIEECKDVIGHIHTAGNPGRAELDDKQEINYPPIMQAAGDRLQGLRRPGIHSDPRSARRPDRSGQALRRVSLETHRTGYSAASNSRRQRAISTR